MARRKQTHHLDSTAVLNHETHAALSYAEPKKRSSGKKRKPKSVKALEAVQEQYALDETVQSDVIPVEPCPNELDAFEPQSGNISSTTPLDDTDNDDTDNSVSDFIEESPQIQFNEQQQAVYDGISAVLDQPSFLCVLNAPAGTGKSTVVKRIIQDHPDMTFHVVSLAAVAAATYAGLPSSNTKAGSVFGNLFKQDLPLRDSPRYHTAFTPTKLREWEEIQRDRGLYAPKMEIKNEEDAETVVGEMSKDKRIENILGVDFFEWFTCEVIAHAHKKWKNKHGDKVKVTEPESEDQDASTTKLISNAPVLIVEEYSMVAILSLFGWMYPRMIFVGDKNQLPAIESLPDPQKNFANEIQASVTEAYRCFGDMVVELAERLRHAYQFKLTKNERDPFHQEWYNWLYDMVERRARQPSPFVQNTIRHISRVSGAVDDVPIVNDSIYLCDTNKCRDTITKKYHILYQDQIRYCSPFAAKPVLSPYEEDCNYIVDEEAFVTHPATVELARYCTDGRLSAPTGAWQVANVIRDKYTRFTQTVIVGGSIMVTKNLLKGLFYNGEIYPVVEDDGQPMILKGGRVRHMPYAPFTSTGDTRLRVNQWANELKAAKIAQWIMVPVFQEANVMTIHKAQGQSLVGKVSVIITSPYFCSQQMLYTAATRCRNVEDLAVYTDSQFDQKFMRAPRAMPSYEKQGVNALLMQRR